MRPEEKYRNYSRTALYNELIRKERDKHDFKDSIIVHDLEITFAALLVGLKLLWAFAWGLIKFFVPLVALAWLLFYPNDAPGALFKVLFFLVAWVAWWAHLSEAFDR